MKRVTKRFAKNDYGKKITLPDVRPLDQREHITPKSARKGMIQHQEVVNISWLEQQKTLF
jgi:hypothetical protein